MKAQQKELIGQAVSALELRDIMLNQCSFRRPASPPTGANEIEARQSTKRVVSFVLGKIPGSDESEEKLLQVIVSLGIRIESLHSKKRPVLFEIEADFLVEYDLKAEVSEAALKAFADFNSVHNVWPFWRQHVFDIVSRARLPRLNVPLFSSQSPRKSAPRLSNSSTESPEVPKTRRRPKKDP